MRARRSTIPREIIDCIGEGRGPSIPELLGVAAHIERDIGPALAARANLGRSLYLRVAQAALTGVA